MSERVVLVTGAFRTGTSLVAQVVHRLGFPVSHIIPAPHPPSWRSDYEDPALTVPLMKGLHFDFAAYLAARRRQSEAFGFGGRVAMKSPFLALRWGELLEAIGEPPPMVIRTFRHEAVRQRSLAEYPALSAKDDEAIRVQILRVRATIEIGYEYAVERPEHAARAIASALGVEDDGAVAAAAALIGNPTRYPHAVPRS